MRNHIVQISDREGHSFHMTISTISTLGVVAEFFLGRDSQPGSSVMTGLPAELAGKDKIGVVFRGGYLMGEWRSVEQGYLRYPGGKLFEARRPKSDIRAINDVVLMTPEGTWGMQLFEYTDDLGVNAEGEGFVIHPWVTGFAQGKFSWVRVF